MSDFPELDAIDAERAGKFPELDAIDAERAKAFPELDAIDRERPPKPIAPQPLPAAAQGSPLSMQPQVMAPNVAPPKPTGQAAAPVDYTNLDEATRLGLEVSPLRKVYIAGGSFLRASANIASGVSEYTPQALASRVVGRVGQRITGKPMGRLPMEGAQPLNLLTRPTTTEMKDAASFAPQPEGIGEKLISGAASTAPIIAASYAGAPAWLAAALGGAQAGDAAADDAYARTYNQAALAGMDETEATRQAESVSEIARAANFALGYLTGRFGSAGRIAGRVTSGVRGSVASEILGDVASQTLFGTGQELASNAIAKELYDPTRNVTEGVGESAVVNAILGGAFGLSSIHEAVPHARVRAMELAGVDGGLAIDLARDMDAQGFSRVMTAKAAGLPDSALAKAKVATPEEHAAILAEAKPPPLPQPEAASQQDAVAEVAPEDAAIPPTQIESPEVATEAAPVEPQPEAIATPEVTPEVAPEVTPEVTPEVAPVEQPHPLPDAEQPPPLPETPPPLPQHPDQPIVDKVVEGITGTKPETSILRVVDRADVEPVKAQLADAVEAALGKRVIYARNESPDKLPIGGISIGADRIVVNPDSPQAISGLVTHETLHSLEESHPAEYAEFSRVIEEEGIGFAEYRKNFEADYRKNGLAIPDEPAIRREFAADTVQRLGTEPSFWQRVYDKSPEAAKRLFAAIRDVVAKITSREVPRDVQPYIRDMERVRDAAAEFFAKVGVKPEDIVTVEPERPKSRRQRVSESIDVRKESVRDALRDKGLFLGRSANVEELRLPPGSAIKIHDKPVDGAIHIDNLMDDLVESGLIPESRRNDYSAVGEMLTGRLASPQDLQRAEAKAMREKAFTEAERLAMQGREPAPEDIKSFPELKKFKGYGRTANNPAEVEGIKAYHDGQSWRIEVDGRWRVVRDPEIIEALRANLPYAEGEAMVEKAQAEGLPFSAEKPRRSLREIYEEKYAGEGQRERKTFTNYIAGRAFGERITAELAKSKSRYYNEQSNAETTDKAIAYIREQGPERAFAAFEAGKTGLDAASENVAGHIIMAEMERGLADLPEPDRIAITKRIVEAAEAAAERVTEAGRAVQSQHVVYQLRSLDLPSTHEGVARRLLDAQLEGKDIPAKARAATEAAQQVADAGADHIAKLTDENAKLKALVESKQRKLDESQKSLDIARGVNRAFERIAKGERIQETVEQRRAKLAEFFGKKKPTEKAVPLSAETGAIPDEIMSRLAEETADFFAGNPKASSTDYLDHMESLFGEGPRELGVLDDLYRNGRKVEASKPVVRKAKAKPEAKKPVEPELPVGTEVEPPSPVESAEVRQSPLPEGAAVEPPREGLTPKGSEVRADMDAAIREAAKRAGVKLRDVVDDHFRGLDPGKTLYEKIVELGLSEKDAAELATEYQRHFDAWIEAEGRKQLEKRFGEKKALRATSRKNSPLDEILMDIRRGALNDQAISDAFAKKYGIKVITPEMRDAFMRKAKRIAELQRVSKDAETDLELDRAKVEAMRYIQAQTVTGWRDVASYHAYWAMLSDVRTQISNALGNIVKVSADQVAAQIYQLQRAARQAAKGNHKEAIERIHEMTMLLNSAWRSFHLGAWDSTYVLVTGTEAFGHRASKWHDPAEVPFGELNPKDISDPKIRAALKAYKSVGAHYVRRALIAADVFFGMAAEEQKAAMLLREAINKDGLYGKAASKEVARRMGYESLAAWHDESMDSILSGAVEMLPANKRPSGTLTPRSVAVAEGHTGTDLAHRVAELKASAAMLALTKMRKQRGEEIQLLSREARYESTMNASKPLGRFGLYAHHIGAIGKNDKALWPVTRFLRIAANMTNAALEYSPYGFWRAFHGKAYNRVIAEGQKGRIIELTPEQRELAAVKASMATVGWSMIGYSVAQSLLAWKDSNWDKDKEPSLYVVGRGPRKDADRIEWQKQGGQENSIVFMGQYYPMRNTIAAPMTAIVGNLLDGIRWPKGQDETTMDRAMYATDVMLSAVGDQSPVAGISGLFRILSSRDAEQKKRMFGKWMGAMTGMVVPGALRFAEQVFDDTKYKVEDLEDAFLQHVPIARGVVMNPDINIMGDDIRRQPTYRFYTDYKRDDEISFLTQSQATPSVPPSSKAYPGATPDEQPYMATELERYKLLKRTGKLFRERVKAISSAFGGQPLPPPDAKKEEDKMRREIGLKMIEDAWSESREIAETELVLRRMGEKLTDDDEK